MDGVAEEVIIPSVDVAVVAVAEGAGDLEVNTPAVDAAVVVAAEEGDAVVAVAAEEGATAADDAGAVLGVDEDAVAEADDAVTDLPVEVDAVAEQVVAVTAVAEDALDVAVHVVAEVADGDQEADSAEASSSRKRTIHAAYEDTFDNPIACHEQGSPDSYDSEASGETVGKLNMASFIGKEVIKLQENARRPYVKKNKYICPYHTSKPRTGKIEDLLQHVRELAHNDLVLRVRGQHAALLQVLVEAGLAEP